MKKSSVAGLSLFCVLACMPLLVSCGKDTSEVSSKQVASFAKRAGLVIPSSAKAIGYEQHLIGDRRAHLILEIPAGDLDAFLKESGLEGELITTTRTGALDANYGKILPAHPKKFREGQKSLGGGYYVDVLVDEDGPTNVVYMIWFGT